MQVNGYFLVTVLISTLFLYWLFLYAMPPSNKRGKYVAEVYVIDPLGIGPVLRWRGRYATYWLAKVAANHKARRYDHFGGVHHSLVIAPSVKDL